ncbi:helix-turn-helix domain-containing protein [Thermoflavimicrobium daqui]|uniref:HTH cro/C1-type domain-containing protein n=1 Tax=Thermoflavimicrobium daqui TaxID=2137476 RepID=A0A364K0V1_9BACL|nr:helix-turn-helix transcriptional regulator [Thermoflavimicrobium daqui]RAL21319.1 hypothetical protein DL897_16910 [Thermoflavimicrobium daqui]
MDNLKELGLRIQQERFNRNMTQRQLAEKTEGYISMSTLSNIEKGACRNIEKVRYILKLLNINELVEEGENKEEELRKLELMIAENNINLLRKKVATWLNTTKITDSNKIVVNYLKARNLYKQKEYEKAKEQYTRTLAEMNRFPVDEKSNIKSSCFNDLSVIEHIYCNNTDKALYYSNSGIDSFRYEGERKHIYGNLLANKCIYLNRLGRTEEALTTMEELKSSHHVAVDAKLSIIDLEASIKANQKMYDSAIQLAMEGIELSRINLNFNRNYQLTTTLGKIYRIMGDLDKAEICLNGALSLERIVTKDHIIPATYIELGLVYIEKDEFEKAIEILNKGMNIANNVNNMVQYLKSKLNLGIVLLRKGYSEMAANHLEDAFRLGKGTALFEEILFNLSKCYLQLGDLDKYVKVSSIYFENGGINHVSS